MKLWLDCEFNGYRGELISLALVAEDGSSLYKVLELPERVDPWVAEHVIPVLGKGYIPVERWQAQNAVEAYLAKFETVHIVTDWPDDVRYFCELMLTGPGRRIDTPPLTFEVVRLDGESDTPHNALADARGLRNAYLADQAKAVAVLPALPLWRTVCNAFMAGARYAGIDMSDRILGERADNAAEGNADAVLRSHGMTLPAGLHDEHVKGAART